MKHFKQREKRKHSIKRQMIAVFAGMVICLFAILLVVNVKFLEPYYIRDKEMQFIHVYEELQEAVKKGTISNDEVQDELHVLCEKNNISYIVLDMDNEKLITNVHDTNMLKQQLSGYLLNQAQKGGKVLDSTDNYQLMRSQDPWNQSEYIEMWGQLDDNVNFLIRSPVESIRESVTLSNRFLIYVGIGTLIICIGLVWYFSEGLQSRSRNWQSCLTTWQIWILRRSIQAVVTMRLVNWVITLIVCRRSWKRQFLN